MILLIIFANFWSGRFEPDGLIVSFDIDGGVFVFRINLINMIGAMPAVAVRHERRRADKRNKRPSQLYLGGPWLPPSPSASPSPHLDRLPEYYLCGKVNTIFFMFKVLFHIRNRTFCSPPNMKFSNMAHVPKLKNTFQSPIKTKFIHICTYVCMYVHMVKITIVN